MLGMDDGISDDTPVYDCCEHCEHFGDENTDDHREPCPEGCNEGPEL